MKLRRREFMIAAAAWPFAAIAQQTKKPYRIGWMSNGPGLESDHEIFRQRLRELGYVDGKNVVIEWRFSQGVPESHLKFAAEFVRLNVDCIVANGAVTVGTALKATKTIPIVMANIDADPVALGYIASLARPGANVTGFTAIAHELAGKRLELLKDLVPDATRVAVLAPAGRGAAATAHVEGARAAAHRLGMQVQLLEARGPADLERVFDAARGARADVLSVSSLAWMNSHRERIAKLTADARLPAIFSNPNYPELGGLMSYTDDPVHRLREVAGYVAKILSGTKPADLPVQHPTKFQLTVNLKTSRALGITIPQTILVRADRIIQ